MPSLDHSLYDHLELQPTATPEDIKRAYRRLALRYHPDKNPADGGERFRAINAAFEVLGDENLRSVYDRYGQMGVDMAKQFGGDSSMAALFVSQGESLLVTSFCLISILIAVLALFPIFVALKADGVVDWSWGVVFIPIWLGDFCGYAFIVSRYFLWAGAEAAEDEATEEEEGGGQLTDEQRQQRRKERQRLACISARILGVKRFLQWTALFLFQLFIVLRLDGSVTWSWATVFIPWFLLELFPLFSNLLRFFATLSFTAQLMDAAGIVNSLSKKIQLFLLIFRQWILRIILAILIVCRADEIISVSWAVVFIPVFLMFVDWIITALVDYRIVSAQLAAAAGNNNNNNNNNTNNNNNNGNDGDETERSRRTPQEEQQAAVRSVKLFKIIAICLFSTLALIVLGMFIARLNSQIPSDSYSVGTILIPVFVVLGLSFCCCCCCLPCMVIIGSANEIDIEQPPLQLETKRIQYGSFSDAAIGNNNSSSSSAEETMTAASKPSAEN